MRCLDGVDFCLMHDILYQGWHLVHNIAVRKAQEQLPGVRFVEFTHSLPLLHPGKDGLSPVGPVHRHAQYPVYLPHSVRPAGSGPAV